MIGSPAPGVVTGAGRSVELGGIALVSAGSNYFNGRAAFVPQNTGESKEEESKG